MRRGREDRPRLHLDASFLVHALVPESPQAEVLSRWLASGRGVAMSALAWAEVLCGLEEPETEALARRIVREHVPLGEPEATEAARLFKLTGQRAGALSDCLIAATAIAAGSPLATAEPSEFQELRGHGLQMGV